jgi:hypothetical protein
MSCMGGWPNVRMPSLPRCAIIEEQQRKRSGDLLVTRFDIFSAPNLQCRASGFSQASPKRSATIIGRTRDVLNVATTHEDK